MTILPVFGSMNPSHERQLWVISQLKLKGSSIAEVARKQHIARAALDAAFHRPADRAEKILAAAVGVTQQELFPERYNDKGQRLFRVVRRVNQPAAA
jgi:Ner family transcriptional regulator